MSEASTSSFKITLKASATALIALVLVGAARADTNKKFFIQNGTVLNTFGVALGTCPYTGGVGRCPFSGTMTIDVTSSTEFPFGHVTAYDITFPGVAPFKHCCISQGPMFIPFGGEVWDTRSINNANNVLALGFTTPTHDPSSLVGFDGGSIPVNTSFVFLNPITPPTVLYGVYGNVTPVPEPSSPALLGAGLLPVIGVIRRRCLNR